MGTLSHGWQARPTALRYPVSRPAFRLTAYVVPVSTTSFVSGRRPNGLVSAEREGLFVRSERS
jgi:hypothetical protein